MDVVIQETLSHLLGIPVDELPDTIDRVITEDAHAEKLPALNDVLTALSQDLPDVTAKCPRFLHPLVTPCELAVCPLYIDNTAASNCLHMLRQEGEWDLPRIAEATGHELSTLRRNYQEAISKLRAAVLWAALRSRFLFDRAPVLAEGRCHTCGFDADPDIYQGTGLTQDLGYCSVDCYVQQPPTEVICQLQTGRQARDILPGLYRMWGTLKDVKGVLGLGVLESLKLMGRRGETAEMQFKVPDDLLAQRDKLSLVSE